MIFKIFGQFPQLEYGISEKSDGAMQLDTNRKKFFQRQGINIAEVTSARQVHSANVVKVGKSHRGMTIRNADGLVTADKNLFLTVTVADCFPVYFYNPVLNAIGLVHSGWRGTVKNIVGQAIKSIGGNPADVLVGIGPGIQTCHFEVQKDVLPNFVEYQEAIKKQDGKIFIDLLLIIKQQLVKSGLKEKNIESCDECTFCSSIKYFSFRRDKPAKVQSMLAYIGKKN